MRKPVLTCIGIFMLFFNAICQNNQGIWTSMPQMKSARAYHTSVAANGKIYVIGGANFALAGDKELKTMETYDPQTKTWEQLPNIPFYSIMSSAVSVKNKIYVIGGEYPVPNFRREVYVLDLETNKWTSRSPMINKRAFFSTVFLNDKIYAIGGRDSDEAVKSRPRDSLSVYTIEEYDIEADKWTIKEKLPFKHFGVGAAALNDKIYILSDSSDWHMKGNLVFEEYDPETGIFIEKKKPSVTRCDASMTVLNGKIYLLGGLKNGYWLNFIEEYDPALDTWVTRKAMPQALSLLQAVTLDDKIYVTGGLGIQSMAVKNAYTFQIDMPNSIDTPAKISPGKIRYNSGIQALEFENFKNGENIEIYNVSGILMKKVTLKNTTIKIDDLPNGIYFVHSHSSLSSTFKLVKQ